MALAKKAGPYDLDLARDIKMAQERHGVSLGRQISDFLALRNAGSGLSFHEYLYFGLYNRPKEDYPAYIGNDRARAAFLVANKLTSWDAAEDKLYFSTLVSNAGLPSPKLFAVAHQTRDTGGAQSLRTNDDVKAFLSSCTLPMFGKPIVASHGDGAGKIIAREGDQLTLDDEQTTTIDEIAADVDAYLKTRGYLFQEALNPSPQIADITKGRIATVRFMVWLGPEGAKARNAVMRLPAGDNRVDNFRRAGNLIAPVDIETGALGAARRGVGVKGERFETHPDTDVKIEGVIVSDFNQAKTLAEKAANIYPNLHIQSWDVALSDQGPSLLEVNPGGNFNIIQLANGRGAFDPEFREFLTWCVKANPGAQSNKKAFKEAKKLLKLT